jgi:serine/threonine-protein kinase
MPPCPSCSATIQEGARYCASCGIALTATSAPTEAATRKRHSGVSDPSSVHGRFLPGTMLGERYRIVGLLGRGGMGEVYRADDLELGQSVALKFLPEELAADPAALDRIRREVRVARQIAHPNICQVYDIGQLDGHVFLSMEYVDGDDLSQVLRRLGSPSKDKALEIARQLCLGLAAAHESKVLHRDLKPANVMLDGRGRVRITDFGLAGLADEIEASSERAGTPAYMAPEQMESGQVSVRSDIYSLGLLLYELFTGKRAFDGESPKAVRRTRSSGSAPSMQSMSDPVDPAIERVIQRCLEPDPADRPPSVYAVLAALPGGDPLAAALAAGETPSPDMVASARGRGGLSPRWAVTLLVLTLGCLGYVALTAEQRTVALESGPAELGGLALRMLDELGHEVPPYRARGLLGNAVWREHRERAGEAAWTKDGPRWPPPYFFWLRASDRSLERHDPHFPGATLGSPLVTPPGSVTLVLDTTGRLVELEVVPEPTLPDGKTEETAAPDWRGALRMAGLDIDTVELVEPPRAAPPYCDEVVAFRAERPESQGGPYVFVAGAHRGRLVHAAMVWDWDEDGVIGGARKSVYRPKDRGLWPQLMELFWAAVSILMIVLAWRNVRLGRGDRRGALVYGVTVFGAYFLYDTLNARISEYGIGTFLSHLFDVDSLGHACVHGILAALTYLAVEPYVRRVWPRGLIGWARLTQRRLKDPAVAREVLIGASVAVGLVSILLSIAVAVWVLLGGAWALAPYEEPATLGNFARMVTEVPHVFALSMLFSIQWFFVLLLVRLLVRRDWATIAVGLVVPATLMIVGLSRNPDAGLWEILFTAVALGVIGGYVVMIVRIGLTAAIFYLFALIFWGIVPFTLDLSAFYAPQAIFGIAVYAAIAVYGFRYSLAGQSVFSPLPSEDRSDSRARQ